MVKVADIDVPRSDTATEDALLREVGLAIADRAAQRHQCQLSKNDRVTVCLRKGHLRDVAWADELLQAVGGKPTPPHNLREVPAGTNHRVLGTCPVCEQQVRIIMDGTVGTHHYKGVRCKGRRRRPIEAS